MPLQADILSTWMCASLAGTSEILIKLTSQPASYEQNQEGGLCHSQARVRDYKQSPRLHLKPAEITSSCFSSGSLT